jgi:hypothetical protein
MSSVQRQSELFAAQDWQVLYRAFTQINFNSSDPQTISAALREYIRVNYPEDFNDWIESSEFIAIIDLLAWLSGILAFKTDINARENFLEKAEARESILRLARFLSYNPRRNQAARGLLKVQAIQTDDDVYDALGNNLQNRILNWNNPDDPDWFERIVLVLNSVFVSTNPFGVPLKNGTLAGVKTQQYRINSRFADLDLSYAAKVGGDTMDFEVINTDFDETLGITERTPNTEAALHMLYRTDGNGNASADTGFFMGFRQGILKRAQYNILNPIENQTIDIDVANINDTDVWVQSLDDNGDVTAQWEKVPLMLNENITFNSIPADIRKVFSVTTRDEDQITLRFGDGRFGEAPVGRLRAWYRSSNGQQYQIRPFEMSQIRIDVPYFNRRGVQRTLTITLGLESPVSNSAPAETEEQIRLRAPQVYSTQNRMVSGEDYNAFPLQSNLATKIKAVNRVYSGHSRFIDLNDPTGNYQDTNVFSDDGMFYKEPQTTFVEIPLSDNVSADAILGTYIQPSVKSSDAFNYVHDFLIQDTRRGAIPVPGGMTWYRVSDGRFSSTGWFNANSDLLLPGAMLFITPPGGGDGQWVTVSDRTGTPSSPPGEGSPGPIMLSQGIESGWIVTRILPRYASTLSNTITQAILAKLVNRLSFTLWYDYNSPDGMNHWTLRDPANLDDLPNRSDTAIKIMSADYVSNALWRFRTKGLRYVFESIENVRFYFDGQKAVESLLRQQDEDYIRVLKVNPDPNTGQPLNQDYDLTVDRMIYYADGFGDPNRIVIRFSDKDADGYPDVPNTYYNIVNPDDAKNSYLFWYRKPDLLWAPYYSMVVYESDQDRQVDDLVATGTVAFQINGARPFSFWLKTDTGWTFQQRAFRYGVGHGPNVGAKWIKQGGTVGPVPIGARMYFQWKHFAPSDRRIDPAKTNIIDIFVLTSEYDFLTRDWIANGALARSLPTAPTELDLRMSFANFENFKMFSDEIIWRPVRYKYLFGTGADAMLRAKFKVVRLANSSMSDGEIKSRVIKAIDEFFKAERWDFGETFYFTELAAYVHQQLAISISSFVLVPESDTGVFGDGFEVQSRSDELFISTAQVTDITIIQSNTPTNLRMA